MRTTQPHTWSTRVKFYIHTQGQGASKKKEDEFLATEAAQALAAKQFYRRATFAEM